MKTPDPRFAWFDTERTISELHSMALDINRACDEEPDGRYCIECRRLNDMADEDGWYYLRWTLPRVAHDGGVTQFGALCAACWGEGTQAWDPAAEFPGDEW